MTDRQALKALIHCGTIALLTVLSVEAIGADIDRHAGYRNVHGIPAEAHNWQFRDQYHRWAEYGADEARIYGRTMTATESGTVRAVRAHLFAAGDIWESAWFVVYKNGTLAGRSAPLAAVAADGWTDFVTLTEEAPETLSFSAGDEIVYGIAWLCDDCGDVPIMRDVDEFAVDRQPTILGSSPWTIAPPATATFESSPERYGLGVILRYTHERPLTEQTYFVTPTGGGSRVGSQNDPWSASDFNHPASWSSSDDGASIDPGDRVCLSGTFSADKLSVAGSGLPGHPVIIDGDCDEDGTNAMVMDDDCAFGGGLITVENQSYITIEDVDFYGGDCPFDTSASAIGVEIIANGTSEELSDVVVRDCDFERLVYGIYSKGTTKSIRAESNTGRDLVGDDGSFYKVTNHFTSSPSYQQGPCWPHFHQVVGNHLDNVNYQDEWGGSSGGLAEMDGITHVRIARNLLTNSRNSTSQFWGKTGVYMNPAKFVVIEYNIFKDFDAWGRRPGVVSKNDKTMNDGTEVSSWTGPFIVRHNVFSNFGGNGTSEPWAGTAMMSSSGNYRYLFFYGNYGDDTGGGVSWNITWYPPGRDDQLHPQFGYAFANVISNNVGGGISWTGPLGEDDLLDFWAWNNTLYGLDRSSDTLSYAMEMDIKPNDMDNTKFFNNLIVQHRPNDDSTKRWVHLKPDAAGLEYDHQHYYDTRYNDPMIRYSYYNPESHEDHPWNGSSRPAPFGANDTFGDPNLSAPSEGDFRVTDDSPDAIISGGYPVGVGDLARLTIAGTVYTIPWGFALGARTRFSLTDPDDIFIDEVVMGVDDVPWGKGAFSPRSGESTPDHPGIVDALDALDADDGAPPEALLERESGCGCTVPSSSQGPSWLLALAALLPLRLRRRRWW